jgi:hypothetical protein
MKHTIRLLFIDDINDSPAILDTTLYKAGFAFYEAKMPLTINGHRTEGLTTLEEFEALMEDK